jgi:hypothetical protein
MNQVFSIDHALKRTSRRRSEGTPLAAEGGKSDRHAVLGCWGETLTVIGRERAERRFAQSGCLFEHRVEHRREIARRGIDDLQHLGARGLPPQRFVPLGCALGKLTFEIGYPLLGIG